ncbi:MAG TPA: ElyC/SanA/YdcF family protein [Myxococcota bacterium]|nr:ElyC/SanA/YdcF family protein [Myxococcota bacterium]
MIVLGKELRRYPERGHRELRARAAAASVALREGARVVLCLEAQLKGQNRPGSQIVLAALTELGVARERIVLDERTRSTREEAIAALHEVRAAGLGRLGVITHGYHVPRVRRYFSETFEPGTYTVLTPEAFLQRAEGTGRQWIEAATPDEGVLAQERTSELLLSALAAALSPLPPPVRWWAEVEAAGIYRSVS